MCKIIFQKQKIFLQSVFEYDKIFIACGYGGMADASDSKSDAHKACGFKSHYPH